MTTRRALFPPAIVALVALAGCGDSKSIDWAIVESGARGESLVIVAVTPLSRCNGDPQVDLRKSNANRVELEVVVDNPSECDSSQRLPDPISVKLAQPLRGQQITGRGLKPPSASPLLDPPLAPRFAGTVPSVVGFRLPDARAILEARGLEVGAITGPKVDATEVTAQSPAAGAPLATTPSGAPAKAIALRTVPR